jgi:hypothetical protein
VTTRPWRTGGSVSVYIDATPDDVYAHISDVTRIGERSPECRSARWLDGATTGTVGTRFRGHNRSGFAARWSRTCEVVDAVPGRSFAFRTVPQRDPTRRDSTTWAYQLQPRGEGTHLTHSYEITVLPLPLMRALYGILLPQHRDMRPQMLQSLQTLKALLEHDPRH